MAKELLLCALLSAASLACNLYDPNNPGLTYLCAGEKCSDDGDSSRTCQSGCCHDGECNDDGQCAKHQLILSVVAIISILLGGTGIYFLYWYMRCKGKPNGLAPPTLVDDGTGRLEEPSERQRLVDEDAQE